MFGNTLAQSTVSQKLNNLILINGVAVYQVTAKNMGCLSNVFNATITVLPVPKLTVTSSPIICRYPTDTITLSFTGKAPWRFNYTDDNSAIKTVTNITSNPYTLLLPITALNSRSFRFMDMAFAGCLNTKDTVDFVQTINNLPVGVIYSLHGQYLCNNILDTLFITSPDSLRYQWTLNGSNVPGALFDSLTTGLGGKYNARIINQFGCVDTIAQSYTLIKMSQPVLKINYDTWCINTTVNFRNLSDTSTTGQIKWLWKFGNGNSATGYNSSNTYLVGGVYHIRLQADQLNCPAYTTTYDTTIDVQIPIAPVIHPSAWAYKSVPTPVAGRTIPGYKYRWTPSWGINLPDSSSALFNYTNTQNYAINLISPGGCITHDSLLVRVYEDKLVELLVPKSFTPNGDGVNDKLFSYLAGIKEFHYFKIYNRFNQVMFETKNYDEGWNGMVNGAVQPMGIYIWVAEGIANDGSLVKKSGQTLLLR
jgi:gliding motility-associated-like protein